MRRLPRRLIASFVFAAAVLAPAFAFAEDSNNYSEKRTDSNTVVKFKDDPLDALPHGTQGGIVVARPPAARLNLMRPRLNFVSELAKTIEKM